MKYLEYSETSPYPSGKKWINGIISQIPHRNFKNIHFVWCSFESLERLEGKTGEGPIF